MNAGAVSVSTFYIFDTKNAETCLNLMIKWTLKLLLLNENQIKFIDLKRNYKR